MATPLRQSTQRVVRIGPAVAVGDGFTPVTTLDLTTADEAEALREGTATLDISGATFAAVTGADGWYDLTLSTTATDTVGELVIVINDDSLILPLYARFTVVEESVYDALFAASAAGYSTYAGGAVASVTGNVGGNVTGSVGSVAGTTFESIRLDELLAADSDIDGAQPPTVGSVFHELMSKTAGSFTFDQTTDSLEALFDGLLGGIETVGSNVIDNGVNIGDILTDTNELQTDWADGGRLDLILDARASQASVDDVPTNAEFASAMALLATSAQLVKVLAAVYDTATIAGDVITLSNAATQTITAGGRTTA